MQNIAGSGKLMLSAATSAAKNFISSRRYNALKIERWDRLAVHRSGARAKLNSSRGKSWPGFEFLPGRNNFIREIVGSIRAQLPSPPSLRIEKSTWSLRREGGEKGEGGREGGRWIAKRREENENREESRLGEENARRRGGRKRGIHGYGVAGTNRGGEWRLSIFRVVGPCRGVARVHYGNLPFLSNAPMKMYNRIWRPSPPHPVHHRSFNDIVSQVMSRVGGRLRKAYVGNPIRDNDWEEAADRVSIIRGLRTILFREIFAINDIFSSPLLNYREMI